MKDKTQTVRKIVGFLNNSDEEGGFWLPNIQRPFVWSEDQICRLIGSILPEEYPAPNVHRQLEEYTPAERFLRAQGRLKKKRLVLAGQQRLQGLFNGLCGSYRGKATFLRHDDTACLAG
jgi:uncharacterized protein with ParB-like and HNH nuclease domain